MPTRAPTFSIILAAGKGTRMRSMTMHKVCFPLNGVPAIHHALQIYNDCGIRHHVIVVGAMAGQVVETVGAAFSNVSYVYQARQQGTAHATRTAMQALETVGDNEDVLVVAGDRIIERSVLEQLFDLFYSRDCDLALPVTPRRDGSTQGRIIMGTDGALLAIVEDADIRQRAAYAALAELLGTLNGNGTANRERVLEVLREHFTRGGRKQVDDSKFATAFGDLWRLLADREGELPLEALQRLVPEKMTHFRFRQADGSDLVLSPAEVDAAPLLNNSVYVIKAGALRHALANLGRDNAQAEEYLSDIVTILSQARDAHGKLKFQCSAMRVENPRYLLGFNDPAELLEVENYLSARSASRTPDEDLSASPWYRPLAEWQAAFAAMAKVGRRGAPDIWDELTAVYGAASDVLEERLAAFSDILQAAAARQDPSNRVLLVRSPGRINVLSRHIDHQGGNCNLMTIGYETLMVVHARTDDRIHLHHIDEERFGHRHFSIGELVQDLPWEDWLSLVNSETLSKLLHTYGGDWSQYITASVLRLQKKFNQQKLRGMDVLVAGNVPMAAGLSSSSSLVVGAADATIAVNDLLTFPSQVVDLCGEGEWFVGTRGGAADHAAVKLGQKGKVIKVSFFDFAVEESVDFPEDYRMVVCDSGIRAQKSANAKDLFNHRISCYRIGFQLIRKSFPQFAPQISYLRDVNVRNLRVPLSWIYRILLHLPEQATRQELEELLPEVDLQGYFATHKAPPDGLYPVRGVVLFGLAECERARLYADYLKAQRIVEIGRLMAISHNGDRVVSHTDDFTERPYLAPTSNGHLLALMDDLESGDPDRVVRAQLQWQPGSYHCSLPPIDRMVDISMRTEGVVGAQLAGAGLGGCMMVLAHREAVDALFAALNQHYYEPLGRPPAILVCKPIAGAGVLMRDMQPR